MRYNSDCDCNKIHFFYRTFVFEFTDNISITNLFGNLCDRIDFLLPDFHEKEHVKLTGKMYRAKLPRGDGKFNSICSLQAKKPENSTSNTSGYLINGKEILKADSFLDLIIGKLNLMYSVGQASYSLEGLIWKSSKDSTALIKCFTIYSGSEAVNILIQVKDDQILSRTFPDFGQESKTKFIELEQELIDDEEDEVRKYFDIIVKTVKLNL